MKVDKKLHLSAGINIAITVGLALTPLIGLVTATAFGVGKELIWDGLMKKGTPEALDAIATIAGGVLGYIIMIIFLV